MRRKARDAISTAGKWTCPYYSLPQIIEFAKLVRQTGGTDVAERQVLKKLGINNRVTRSWSYRLSSAKEFGLLDRKGRKEEARLLVTDLCVRLLTSSDERLDAARMNAFRQPPLYVKLVERYLDVTAPNEEDLASVLVRDFELLESVAVRAARAFLESAQFAGVITANGHITSTANVGRSKASPPPLDALPTEAASELAESAPSADGLIAHRFQLRPDVAVVVRLPSDLNQSDVARLHRWLRTLPFEDSEE